LFLLSKLLALRRAPLAAAYWLGVAGSDRRNDGHARILMFHGTPHPRAAAFARGLRYLKRHFDIVPLSSIAADAASPDVRFRRQIALTFDDGLRNNIEVAYPILKKLGVPATFFVCPGLIERGQWLWNHEARQRLQRLRPEALRELALDLGAPADVEEIVQWMKTLNRLDRERAEERVRDATHNFAPSARERHEFDLAGWDELLRLDPAIVTIGSHTMTHPILPQLSAAAIEAEVSESRRALEARLDRQVDLFAYPNGNVNAATHESVRRNYRAAVTVEEGTVESGCDPHLLPRVSAFWSALRMALALHRDYFFVTPTRASGSQVASSGNAVISAMHSTIMKKNGSEASAT
jgi:peptidoglycan/xylan/chitin deacetylase (PgdA/CDA1 family)